MSGVTTVRGYESMATVTATAMGTTIVQLTTANIECGAVWMKSMPGNAGTIYIGNSNVGTATGFPLVAGDVMVIEVANANRIWGIASAASQDLRWIAYSRY